MKNDDDYFFLGNKTHSPSIALNNLFNEINHFDMVHSTEDRRHTTTVVKTSEHITHPVDYSFNEVY